MGGLLKDDGKVYRIRGSVQGARANTLPEASAELHKIYFYGRLD